MKRMVTEKEVAEIASAVAIDEIEDATIESSQLSSGEATEGQVLTADGSGGVSWENASGGGGYVHFITLHRSTSYQPGFSNSSDFMLPPLFSKTISASVAGNTNDAKTAFRNLLLECGFESITKCIDLPPYTYIDGNKIKTTWQKVYAGSSATSITFDQSRTYTVTPTTDGSSITLTYDSGTSGSSGDTYAYTDYVFEL